MSNVGPVTRFTYSTVAPGQQGAQGDAGPPGAGLVPTAQNLALIPFIGFQVNYSASATGSEMGVDWGSVPGDSAWHTIATIAPDLIPDECIEIVATVTLRRVAGTGGAVAIRRYFCVQNNGGTLSGYDGATSDHSVDVYGTAGTAGAPTGALARLFISGSSIVVQAQASQSALAKASISYNRALAPGFGPTVQSVIPKSYNSMSTTPLAISGLALGAVTAAGIKIGATKYPALGLTVTSTTINGTLTGLPIGKGFVYVTVGATDYVSSTPFWSLNAAGPTGVVLSPTSGTAAGGTSITVTASGGLIGIDMSGFGVTLDGVPATINTVTSDGLATITSAAGSSGTGNAIITTPTGTETLVNGWTYIASFTPATRGSQLYAWYSADAAQITHSGGNVTGWLDQGVGANNLTVVATPPPYTASYAPMNNQPVTGPWVGAGELKATGSSLAQPSTTYVFLHAPLSTGAGNLTESVTGIQYVGSESVGTHTAYGDAGTILASGVAQPTTPTFYVVVFNGSTSTVYSGSTTVGVVTGNAGAAGLSGLILTMSQGYLAEVVITNVADNLTQVQQMIGYAATKFGQSWT